MKKLYLLLYYLIFSKLPNYSFPGGKIYNALRIWALRKVIPIGKNVRIMRNVYVGDGNNVSIGDNCRINENVRLDNVKIGNGVLIARETVVLGKMHEFGDTNEMVVFQGNRATEPTIIEDDVWIGLRVIVMPGIRIAKGTIVGAGAVLTKSTEPYGIYAGVPAKLIRKRN